LLGLARKQQNLVLGVVVAVPVLKRAESTTTYALIGEVDVSVYNKRDLIFAPTVKVPVGAPVPALMLQAAFSTELPEV
jgi:hypothetical protein